MGVSGPGSGGRCPTAGAVMVCDDMALRERRREEQKLKFSLGRAVRGGLPGWWLRVPVESGLHVDLYIVNVCILGESFA